MIRFMRKFLQLLMLNFHAAKKVFVSLQIFFSVSDVLPQLNVSRRQTIFSIDRYKLSIYKRQFSKESGETVKVQFT